MCAAVVNQQVAHEIIALQLLTLLLEKPTDDSVELSISFIKEVRACPPHYAAPTSFITSTEVGAEGAHHHPPQ